MADPLSEIEQIRARHRQITESEADRYWCHACEQTWPCDASLLLAALSEAEASRNIWKDAAQYSQRNEGILHDLIWGQRARLEALEGAAREMLKPFSDQLRARVALAAAIEAERG